MDPYIGEIRLFAGNFEPFGWAFCNGQMLQISDNEILFMLIGTTYGGDGMNTFALPDLRGRIPLHMVQDPSFGTTYALGQAGGSEAVTLTTQQIPVHGHSLMGASTTPAVNRTPVGNLPASTTTGTYSAVIPSATLSPTAVLPAGGSQPHDNMMPFTCINYIISLYGIYPSQS